LHSAGDLDSERQGDLDQKSALSEMEHAIWAT
jgi:hypothetical protein